MKLVPSGVWPFQAICTSSITDCGRRETMPIVMMSDTPLPMPRSVICSPSQVKTIVVVVSTRIVIRMKTCSLPRKSGWFGWGRPILAGLIIASATIMP